MAAIRDRELRLALVCYGGISLAVYMHGITKEIWRLARASRCARDGTADEGGSERIYRGLIEEIERETGTRLRILVDIVSGASAGGINSVFLAQAIATGQSLDPLTKLWLEHADIEALLAPSQAPSHRFQKVWATPLAWMIANRTKTIDQTVEAGARDEVRHKLEKFVRSRWFEPPFGGKQLTHTIMDALDAMREAPAGPRLLPDGQPLDLFVTVTDFRGHKETLRLNSPPTVVETEHRLVFGFSDHGAGGSFAECIELAFAARATSSFPGAFPPATVEELDEVVEERKIRWQGRDAYLEHMLPQQWQENRAEKAVLIDGSVLANAPFRPAIEALRERPARRQVDRRFIFIDPHPNARFDFYGTPQDKPGFFQTLIGALSELPREQPIRDNLDEIAHRSNRIERMLDIITAIRADVETQVEALFGYTLFLDYPTPKRLAAWRRRAQVAAAAKAGYGHTAYGLLKVDGAISRTAWLLYTIGDRKGPEVYRAIRAALARAVRERGCDSFGATQSNGASPATLEFLRAHDLGFRIRRLRLLARRLTELDAEHNHTAELLPVREAVYDALAAYLECKRSDPFSDLRDEVRTIGEDAGPLLDKLAERMSLKALDARTDERLSEGFSKLSRELRRPMLLAHLGFPFFDIATLPLLQGEGMDEFDPIRVDRIAPDDAVAIRSGGAEATLKGIQFNSFGAFFSRAYRENDYLWGRLHGADRLIDIILSTVPAETPFPKDRVKELKRAAFHAILDEEEPRLAAIPGLFKELRAEIG
jgi:patatin-related protein